MKGFFTHANFPKALFLFSSLVIIFLIALGNLSTAAALPFMPFLVKALK